MMDKIHILPINDLYEHDENGFECLCGPDVKYRIHNETDCIFVIHNAWDGRKMMEEKELNKLIDEEII